MWEVWEVWLPRLSAAGVAPGRLSMVTGASCAGCVPLCPVLCSSGQERRGSGGGQRRWGGDWSF